MRRVVLAWMLALLFPLTVMGQNSATSFSTAGGGFSASLRGADEEPSGPITLKAGKYAVFHTSEGDFIAQLFDKETPKTVSNFIGLATGKAHWKHPISMADMNQPLYNNTTIYKIVRDVVICGGDPIDKGTGGPGYTLERENAPSVNFNQAGVLAMDNSGKQSNGSRWLVTLMPLPDWKDRFAPFGHVIGGLDVVRDISRKPTKRPLVPLEPTLLNSIEIVEVPQGQQTTASFSTEDTKKVLSVDRNFTQTPEAIAAAAAAQAAETSATVKATTATATSTTAPATAAPATK